MSMMSDDEAIALLQTCVPLAEKLEKLAAATGEEFASEEYLARLVGTPDEQLLYNFKQVWATSLVTKEHIRKQAGLDSHQLLVLAHLLSLYDTYNLRNYYRRNRPGSGGGGR
jgi:hypothetical protein